jgi:2,3-bisphosphoglycerate-independent phosphoglycerate mutase
MVGHTGNMAATQKAVEALDAALAEVTDAILAVGGELLITADHGNAELMVDPETGAPVTSHTVFPVPLIYVSAQPNGQLKDGRLCDIAPTILHLLQLPQPTEMTGENLLV